ncbi:MAG: ABC transporter substrate-binding protein [Deltaproteobacteria bacterium]|nr:ABC transporter substrate-binding protein [Deltaproteobacteria bacterium]
MRKTGLLAIIFTLVMLTTTSVFAADTIKVGVPLAATGAYAGSGDNYWKGIDMAINEINKGGGLLGKQLEVVRFDSQEFAPEIVMQGANYLCGKMKVASVHAGWAGWGQDIRAYGKYDAPFFCDDGALPAVEVYKSDPEKYYNTYFITDTGGDQASSMFNMLTALPYDYPNKKIVIINTDDAWGMEVGDTLSKRFTKIGWKVAKRETVPYGTNEWGPILTKIRRINPAIIHIEIPSSQEVITFFRQFIKQPTDSILSYGWSITPLEVLTTLGKDADGIVGEMPAGMPAPKAPNAKSQAWVDQYMNIYKHPVPAGSWIAYTSVMAWADAVKAVGDEYDFKAVNKHLKDVGYDGLQGKMKFGENNTLHAQPAAPIVHYQVQDGKLVALFTDPPLKPYGEYKFQVPRWIKK